MDGEDRYSMVSAHEALTRLREGNLRFASNERGSDAYISHTRRAELAAGQQPFAIILGCSDSRVPAEIVFDQGLGDLFVIRVAGNIVAPSQVGSVEFAAARYGTRLVVVLGHSQCGAILAAGAPALAALATIVCVVAAQRPAPPAGPDSARKNYTPADVHFMTGMIAHHAQAVLVAGWAPTHGASASLRALCERIVVGQG